MAKRVKEIPTDPAKLREMLEKLKDKEARLEADLAIKEHPELEDAIAAIVIAMTDVRKIDDTLKVMDRPKVDNSNQINRLKEMIRFYENKIESVKAQIAELSEGSDEKYLKLKSNRANALAKLHEQIAIWEDTFGDADAVMIDLIPSLEVYVPKETSGD